MCGKNIDINKPSKNCKKHKSVSFTSVPKNNYKIKHAPRTGFPTDFVCIEDISYVLNPFNQIISVNSQYQNNSSLKKQQDN